MPPNNANLPMFRCDECGEWYTQYGFAETVEGWLCEKCASGICEAGDLADELGMDFREMGEF